jgi:hypothetical protein
MLHSALSEDELERWVITSPADLDAKVEMVRRAKAILAGQSNYVKELEAQAEQHDADNRELLSQVRHLNRQLLQFEQV